MSTRTLKYCLQIFCKYLFAYFIVRCIVYAKKERNYISAANLFDEKAELYKFISKNKTCQEKPNHNDKQEVTLQIYYETLSPECIQFSSETLKPVIEKLGSYLNIQTYPYGKAQSYLQNGRLVIECHHGNEECYGNKLHACSIALVPNRTKALLFNSCMMCPKDDSAGSDDVAADNCGKIYDIDALTIKDCAKGCRGVKLLEHYSNESNKVHYEDVPFMLINGKQNNEDNFMYHVCATFTNPPPPCRRMFDFRKRK